MSQNLINFGNLITEAEKLLIIKTVYKNLVKDLISHRWKAEYNKQSGIVPSHFVRFRFNARVIRAIKTIGKLIGLVCIWRIDDSNAD